jgi:hypothetical protein
MDFSKEQETFHGMFRELTFAELFLVLFLVLFSSCTRETVDSDSKSLNDSKSKSNHHDDHSSMKSSIGDCTMLPSNDVKVCM